MGYQKDYMVKQKDQMIMDQVFLDKLKMKIIKVYVKKEK